MDLYPHGCQSSLITDGYKKPYLTLLHSERPKLYTILAFLSAIGLNRDTLSKIICFPKRDPSRMAAKTSKQDDIPSLHFALLKHLMLLSSLMPAVIRTVPVGLNTSRRKSGYVHFN